VTRAELLILLEGARGVITESTPINVAGEMLRPSVLKDLDRAIAELEAAGPIIDWDSADPDPQPSRVQP